MRPFPSHMALFFFVSSFNSTQGQLSALFLLRLPYKGMGQGRYKGMGDKGGLITEKPALA